MIFLRELGVTLLYGMPLGFAGCFAARYLTKRFRLGGVWPIFIAFLIYVVILVIFKIQLESLGLRGASVAGIAGWFLFIIASAEAASTRPLIFKKEKPRSADSTPEKRARDERAHEEPAQDEQDQQRQELRR